MSNETSKTNLTKGKLINTSVLLGGAVAGWLLYSIVSLLINTYSLIEFYGENNYVFNVKKWTIQGTMINPKLIPALKPMLNVPVEKACPNVKSLGGGLPVMGVSGSYLVCCPADKDEELLPMKRVGSKVQLLCGKWPAHDIVEVDAQSIPFLSTKVSGND